MIIAQWLYTNREGTFWIANANGCIIMNGIGRNHGGLTGSHLSCQKAGLYVKDQTHFRLEFITE